MSTSFSGCLPFCVKLVLCYRCLLSLWRNKYDDDDVLEENWENIYALWIGMRL